MWSCPPTRRSGSTIVATSPATWCAASACWRAAGSAALPPSTPIRSSAGRRRSRPAWMPGSTVPVPQSRPLLIGRSPQADISVDSPSVSWSHASVEHDGDGLRVRDSGSTNGTLVDGVEVGEDGILVENQAVVLVGGSAITLWQGSSESLAPAPGTLQNLTHSATVPFNRPPRAGLTPAPESIVPPARKDPPPPARFGLAAIIAPLLMAVVMVMVMRDLRFALFAALSPVMAVGSTVEQKRRRKKDVRESDQAFDKAMDQFRDDLESAARVERDRRRELAPDPALTLRRADLPTTRLWQRRPGASDFLVLNAGVGNVRLAASARGRHQQEAGRGGPACRRRGRAGERAGRRRSDRRRGGRHRGRAGGLSRGRPQSGLPGGDPLRTGRSDGRGLLRPGSRRRLVLGRLAAPRPAPGRRLRRSLDLDRARSQRRPAARPARRGRRAPDPVDAAGPRLRRADRGTRRPGPTAARVRAATGRPFVDRPSGGAGVRHRHRRDRGAAAGVVHDGDRDPPRRHRPGHPSPATGPASTTWCSPGSVWRALTPVPPTWRGSTTRSCRCPAVCCPAWSGCRRCWGSTS